ncbi:serine/threonine-protein kinase [Actinomadura pelletieri]|uniref:serine/threonine-protein kinase n=1 Tax=Actinomadura pelletieri TaxID=111805 RepID=UPI0011C35AAC|nr:serine/threonine-protein kinase [Actinomadura pelletieri]
MDGTDLLVEDAVIAGRYQVVELLGEGAMGQVWRGEDLRLERPVAVKVLQPHLMHGSVQEQALERFAREGRAAARLTHRNIALVHDVGEHDGLPYLVLEYLHGPDLKRLLDGHPGGLPIDQVLGFGAQAAEGLAAAHAAGIVHRDIKPHNLMLTADGTVKICDFGIARLRDATSGLTGGATIGTVAYMAPEQLTGEPVDHRADLYALGATVFQLLTGRHVFTGDDVRSVIAQHLATPPPPARTLRSDAPSELENYLHVLLAKEPDQRPRDAAAVAEHLYDLWRRHTDPDHPVNAMRTRFDQAKEHGEAGRHDVAIALLQSLISDSQRVLGRDHTHTLTSRQALAHWTGKAGDPARARDQLTYLLHDHQHILGPDDIRTLTIRENLAYWTGEAGSPVGARDEFTRLLHDHERVLGPEHPFTLHVRGHFAYWTGKAGDFTAARDQFAYLLPLRARILGPDHPDTLNAANNLALWTGKAGDPAQARDQYAHLLRLHERVLGPDHPQTVKVRHSLDLWTRRAKERR